MRWLLPLLLSGCHDDLTADAEPPALDEAYFRCRVQPLVTKSCSMFACHGDEDRYLVVYGRNRLRMSSDESERNSFLTDDERAANYAAVRAYTDPERPEHSYLLKKALAEEAGGFWHGGATTYGHGDVYLDTEDLDYLVLAAWIAGEEEDPGCEEPGSNL